MYTFTLRCRIPRWAAPLAAVAALAVAAGPAHGDEAPAFTAAPAIQGPAVVAAELRVVASWRGVPAPASLYEWDRCDVSGLLCDVVGCTPSHVVTDGDVGQRLRAQIHLVNTAGGVVASTPFTDTVVKDARPIAVPGAQAGDQPVLGSCTPAAPPPQPKPARPEPARPKPSREEPSRPKPSREEPSRDKPSKEQPPRQKPSQETPSQQNPSRPKPTAPPAAPATQPSAPLPAPVPPAAGTSVYMRPFPIVRIRGYSVAGGARITVVSVRGKPSALIRGTCAGAGCPRRDPRQASPPARLRALERFYRAGTVLQIRVTAGQTIGKYTSFRILAHRPPRRVDRCLLPGRWAPVRCPAS